MSHFTVLGRFEQQFELINKRNPLIDKTITDISNSAYVDIIGSNFWPVLRNPTVERESNYKISNYWIPLFQNDLGGMKCDFFFWGGVPFFFSILLARSFRDVLVSCKFGTANVTSFWLIPWRNEVHKSLNAEQPRISE